MADSILFPRQIGRLSFAIRYVLFLGLVWLGAFLLASGVAAEAGKANIAILSLSLAVLLFALFYLIRYILIARLRDVGLHSLWALLIFVPIVNLIFVLVLLCVPAGGFTK